MKVTYWGPSSDRIVQMEVRVEIFSRWEVERRGGGSKNLQFLSSAGVRDIAITSKVVTQF